MSCARRFRSAYERPDEKRWEIFMNAGSAALRLLNRLSSQERMSERLAIRVEQIAQDTDIPLEAGLGVAAFGSTAKPLRRRFDGPARATISNRPRLSKARRFCSRLFSVLAPKSGGDSTA
jgi:hypothetical protein